MIKLEIKQVTKLSSTCPKKTYVAYFENEEDAKEQFQSIKTENEVVKEKENQIIFIERKTSRLLQASLKSCLNSDIPKLKENQIWIRLFSDHLSNKTMRESMIIEFKEKEDFDKCIEKKDLDNKYNSFNYHERSLKCYLNKFDMVVYATRLQ